MKNYHENHGNPETSGNLGSIYPQAPRIVTVPCRNIPALPPGRDAPAKSRPGDLGSLLIDPRNVPQVETPDRIPARIHGFLSARGGFKKKSYTHVKCYRAVTVIFCPSIVYREIHSIATVIAG